MTNILPHIQVFINDYRKWLKIVLFLFLVSGVVGVAAFFVEPQLLEDILKVFSEKFGEDLTLNFDLVYEIFLQNVTASAIALFGGLILGIAPVLIVLVNGFVLGVIITPLVLFSDQGIFNSILVVLVGIVPHGIIELPAFFVAAALGLRLGTEWLSAGASGQRWATLGRNFLQGIKYFLVIVSLLFVAALVEVFISGKLVEKLG